MFGFLGGRRGFTKILEEQVRDMASFVGMGKTRLSTCKYMHSIDMRDLSSVCKSLLFSNT